MNYGRIVAGLALSAMGLTACIGDVNGDGQLTLGITDAPVDDATAVVVQFTGVEVKPMDGNARSFNFDTPRSIDLLALAGGGSEILLDGVTVPAGGYAWVRLKVDAVDDGTLDSYITLKDGTQHELTIPSGAETGLKLVSGFSVPSGGSAAFTLDFDLRKSVHDPMNGSTAYTLRPTLRIVDNAQVGAIAGRVDSALIGTTCTPAVYVFAGSSVTPDDVDGTVPEPQASATVALDSSTGFYQYKAGFLAAGDYTVSFTCDAAMDNPDTSETLTFVSQNATVAAGQTTTADFAVGP